MPPSVRNGSRGGAVAGRHPVRVTGLGLHLLPNRRGKLLAKRRELAVPRSSIFGLGAGSLAADREAFRLAFQIPFPLVGLLIQPIRQDEQLAVNEWIATCLSTRHSPKKFGLLAELLNANHVKCLRSFPFFVDSRDARANANVNRSNTRYLLFLSA